MRSRLPPPAVVLIALWASACRSQQPTSTAEAAGGPEAREVSVTSAQPSTLNRTITLSGALAAEEQAVLSPRIAGRIQRLAVDLGSTVAEGQEIARIDPTDFELRVAQSDAALRQARARLGLSPEGTDEHVDPDKTALVRQAQAVLDEARLTLERTRTFVARGIASRAELDSAEASYKVAEGRLQDAHEEVRNRQAVLAQRRSELELAKELLAATTLRAPFAGRIRERPAALGQYVAAGTPIVTLVRVHPLRLRLEVPEREATSVRRGQPVEVTVEGDPTRYTGSVARLSPAISEDNRTLLVEAEIPNERGVLRPGSFARAEIIIEAGTPALLIPTAAVVSFAGVDKVFSVSDGKAVERRVRLGRREQARVEVLEGLSAGDTVIVDPGNLVDGDAVRVAPVR